ncbi:16S rRNA (adenine(1518)-N(6)/adenine(1519)-N(6))-dimethyltransferase RsmA [Wenzhouxiangella sp. XN79A]|uniref:16S rRNA (adenine(1518)-N(6)/adenine(1519)-N(6))- dimethyltransferase RsmA n=1 Tax=Wenzhouxiangella sp. XN79A TaxID=2724193 RepID=UPI00144ADCED|nr:16S rRNA (adenine(1518)-N(6)/adenine(1519)-N(6))-dimethyltransferase RsmA [Wenzhouxiangella sp. XN79A]NKI34279.1 16S rRNA (adenine(1518)-N(6)/adenine(1519)-N(6))-dimethyltransferase RsmA [Wenzhouxiangella sp. XN79A]
MNHTPRKRFGQNFLEDASVIDRIVGAVAPGRSDRVVEIGPGLGALTRPLLERLDELHVVELDRDLVATLAERLGHPAGLVIHQADALDFDFASLAADGPIRVVGNLPYNISTPLLFHLLDQAESIRDMHFMLQKEVVDRICAAPGGKTWGRLGVMTQLRADATHLFTVPPGAFRPPPKVDSAIVRIVPRAQSEADRAALPQLERVVRAAFSQRRKTLRNTLKGIVDSDGFAAAGIDPGRRAETLTLDDFRALAASAGPA